MAGLVVEGLFVRYEAGVVDQDVDPIEGFGAGDEGGDGGIRGEIEGPDVDGGGGMGLEELGGGELAFGRGPHGEDEFGEAEGEELVCEGQAEACVGAGDDGGLGG